MKEVAENTWVLFDGSIVTFDGAVFEMFPSKEWRKKTKTNRYIYEWEREKGIVIFENINMIMKNKVIATYKVVYQNGVTQHMNLISHEDYVNIVIPAKEKIDHLLTNKSGLSDVDFKANQKIAKQMKSDLKEMFSDNFFTDKSPIYMAIETGVLSLPVHQGGDRPCSVTMVSEPIFDTVEIE